jgi:hypothetical protein
LSDRWQKLPQPDARWEALDHDLQSIGLRWFLIFGEEPVELPGDWRSAVARRFSVDGRKRPSFYRDLSALTEMGLLSTAEGSAQLHFSRHGVRTAKRPSTHREPTVNEPSTHREPTVNEPSTLREHTVNEASTHREPTVNEPSTVGQLNATPRNDSNPPPVEEDRREKREEEQKTHSRAPWAQVLSLWNDATGTLHNASPKAREACERIAATQTPEDIRSAAAQAKSEGWARDNGAGVAHFENQFARYLAASKKPVAGATAQGEYAGLSPERIALEEALTAALEAGDLDEQDRIRAALTELGERRRREARERARAGKAVQA